MKELKMNYELENKDPREIISYKETLEIVEEMMNRTGIREFCSKVCKGACCSSHCEDSKVCPRVRKLSCSAWICQELTMAIKKFSKREFTEREQEQYEKYMNDINKLSSHVYYRIRNKLSSWADVYYTNIPECFLKELTFSKSIVCSVRDVNIKDGWQKYIKFNEPELNMRWPIVVCPEI